MAAAPLILIVDDATNIQRTLALSLESVGYSVLTAGTGETALSLLTSQPETALVIIDINLPGMSGFDVIEKIMAIPQFQRPKICLMSGSSHIDDVERAAKLRVFEYIVKPIDEAVLLAKVTKLLGKTNAAPSESAAKVGSIAAYVTNHPIVPDLKIIALSEGRLRLEASAAFIAGTILELTAPALEKVGALKGSLRCTVTSFERGPNWGHFLIDCAIDKPSGDQQMTMVKLAGLPPLRG